MSAKDTAPEEMLGERMHNRLHSYNIECPQCGKNHKYSTDKVYEVATTPRNPANPVVSVQEALKDEELSDRMHQRLHSYNIECKQCGQEHAPFKLDTSVMEHIFGGDSTPEDEMGDKMHNRLHSYNIECPQCGKNHKYSTEKVHKVATTPRNPANPTLSVDEALKDEEMSAKMHERLHSYNIECKECGEKHAPFSLDTSVIAHIFGDDNTPEEEMGQKMHNRLHSYNIECTQCAGKDPKCDCKK